MPLRKRQRDVIDHVLGAISRHNVTVTGPPGSGKTVLTRVLLAELAERGPVLVVATMVLALQPYVDVHPNVTAMTVARLLALRRYVRGHNFRLVVEEFGTVSGRHLDAVCDKLQYEGRDPKMVLVGDHAQLPPVEGGSHFEARVWYQCWPRGRWPRVRRPMDVLALSAPIRFAVKDDWRAKAAAALRRRDLVEADRLLAANSQPVRVAGAFTIVATNEEVDRICKNKQRRMEGCRWFTSEIEGQAPLYLWEGCQAMVVRTGGVAGIPNGAICAVVSWMQMTSDARVVVTRETVSEAYIVLRWQEEEYRVACEDGWGVKSFAAGTVHKFQGQTIPTAVVDCNKFSVFCGEHICAQMMLVAITRSVESPVVCRYPPGLIVGERAAGGAQGAFERFAAKLTESGAMKL